MGDSSLALETRSDFIFSLKDCKIEEKKKCILENEVQEILEALEAGRYEAPIADIPVAEQRVVSQSLGQAHDHLPCMSDSLEVEYSPERGRFAVASKFIPAGSVLIVEPAVAAVCREEFSQRYCDLCYGQIQLRLLPCPGCAEVAFCSPQCREKALAGHHRYECGRRFIFGKILENAKKASGGKTVIGSTVDFSKLCFRVWSWSYCLRPRYWRYISRPSPPSRCLGIGKTRNLCSRSSPSSVTTPGIKQSSTASSTWSVTTTRSNRAGSGPSSSVLSVISGLSRPRDTSETRKTR